MSSDNGKRVIGAILAIGVAAVLMTGCTSATGEGSEPAPSATGAVSREALSVYNRARGCFQNLTSRDINYQFSDLARNDQDEELSPLAGTLGRNALICAALSGNEFGEQGIYFLFKAADGHQASIRLFNSSNFLVTYTDPYPSRGEGSEPH